MSNTNTNLGKAFIDVIPNMSGFTAEIRRQFNNMDFGSIGKEIGESLSEGIKGGLDFQPIVEEFANLGKAAESSSNTFGGFWNTLNDVASVASITGLNIKGLGDSIAKSNINLKGLRESFTGLLTQLPLLSSGSKNAGKGMQKGLGKPAVAKGGMFTSPISSIKKFGPRLLKAFAPIGLLVAGAFMIMNNDAFRGMMESVKEAVSGFIANLPDIVSGIVEAIKEFAPKLLAGAIDLFSSLVDAVTEVAAPVIAGIVELATSIVGKLPTLIPKLLDAALGLFGSIIGGVRPCSVTCRHY